MLGHKDKNPPPEWLGARGLNPLHDRVYSGNPLANQPQSDYQRRGFDVQRMNNEQVRPLSQDDIANLVAGHAVTIFVPYPHTIGGVTVTLQPPRKPHPSPFMYGPDIAREMGGEA